MPLNLIVHPKTLIQINEIGAATQQNMLAVVQQIIGCRIIKARGSTTKPHACFNEGDFLPGISKSKCCGNTSQTAAEDEGVAMV